MTEPYRISAVYVEFGADRPPFAWRDGTVVGPDQQTALTDLHRDLTDLVAAAESDESVPGGRLVRAGDRWLAEADLGLVGENGRRLTATVLINAAGPPAGWARAAASEVTTVLAAEQVPAERGRIEQVLLAAGRSGPFDRRVGAAVALGVFVLLWVVVRRLRTGSPG